jgi:TPR repeat protein
LLKALKNEIKFDMKKIQFLIAILFFISTIIKKDVESGKAFLNNQNRKEAHKMFDSAIRQSKTKKYKEGHPDAFLLIGDAYLTCISPNIEAAFQFFSSACKMDSQYCDKLNDPIFSKIKSK